MTSVTIVTIGSDHGLLLNRMIFFLTVKSLHHIYVTYMCRKNAKTDIV